MKIIINLCQKKKELASIDTKEIETIGDLHARIIVYAMRNVTRK